MEKKYSLKIVIIFFVITLSIFLVYLMYTTNIFDLQNDDGDNGDPNNNNASESSWYYLFQNNSLILGAYPARYWISYPENMGMENHIPFKVDENLSHIDFGFNTRYYSTMNIQCILYKMSKKDGEYEIEKELYASNETTQHHHRIWITPENQGYWTFVISNPNEIATKAGVYAIAFKKENK